MCIIILAPPGVEVPLDTIDKACAKNPDWWGMSYKDEHGLHIRRGLSPRSAKKAWRRAPLNTERIFHARIGTSGTKDIRNTHPFDCGEREGPRRLLFHNGMVSMPLIKAEYCDTWHLAQSLRMGTNDEIKKALVSYATLERSRFCVQNEDPTVDTLMYGNWTKRDGAYYSNTFIFPFETKSYFPTQYTPPAGSVQLWDDKLKCWVVRNIETGAEGTKLPTDRAETREEFFDRLAEEENEDCAWGARFRDVDVRESDRVEAMVDLAWDATCYFEPQEHQEVFDRVYKRYHEMTDAEFEAVMVEGGYGYREIENFLGKTPS